jgi:hypothetical protein
MRGVRLSELVEQLRAEIGHSTNPAVGTNARDYLVQVLRRTQQRLWEEYDWSFLKVSRDIPVIAGHVHYSLPSDLPYDRVLEASFKYDGQWHKLCHGIDEHHYSQYDPEANQRHWPVTRWDIAEDTGTIDEIGVLEIWPMPSRSGNDTSGKIRLTGQRSIAPLVDDSSKCELDGTLIVLYAAAEIQARQNQGDAQFKLQQATQLLSKLQNQTTNKKKFASFNTGAFSPCGAFDCDSQLPRALIGVAISSGGDMSDCIPITGTSPSSPVTGNVQFARDAFVALDARYTIGISSSPALDGPLLFLTDQALANQTVPGELRSYSFSVSDGDDLRTITLRHDGTIRAGRADLPGDATDATLVTLGHLNSQGFIPITGTAEGAPVTGNIDVTDDAFVSFGVGQYAVGTSTVLGLDNQLLFLPDVALGGDPAIRGYTFVVHDGTTQRTTTVASDGTVQAGRPDIPVDAPGSTLITKAFFEGVIPPSGQYIPLAGTSGASVSGSVDFADDAFASFGGGQFSVGTSSDPLLENQLLFLSDVTLGGSAALRGYTFKVCDGTTERSVTVKADGSVSAGRADLGDAPNDSTLITKGYFEAQAGVDGPFVSLAGTTPGAAVSGSIELEDDAFVALGEGQYNIGTSSVVGIDSQLLFLPDSSLGGQAAVRGYTFQVCDGSTTRSISLSDDGMIRAGRNTLPAGSPGNMLVTKQHVEDTFLDRSTSSSQSVAGDVTFNGELVLNDAVKTNDQLTLSYGGNRNAMVVESGNHIEMQGGLFTFTSISYLGGYVAALFRDGNTNQGAGSISTTGATTNYNTSSDYRLKTNVRPEKGNALAALEAVDAVRFEWADSGIEQVGFLAHEIQEYAPWAVLGEKNGAGMQQVDYSKIVGMLWAQNQALLERIKQLEAAVQP